MMKFRIISREKDQGQYDWVFDYFDERQKVSAPPYLWTRIHTRLRQNSDWITGMLLRRKLYRALKVAFPLMLLLVIGSGIFIGKELSDNFCTRIYPCSASAGGSGSTQEIPFETGFSDESVDMLSMSKYLNNFNGGGF